MYDEVFELHSEGPDDNVNVVDNLTMNGKNK